MQCNNYFVQNAAENFTFFYGAQANMLCSKVCRFHFIQQNESLVSCAFCSEWGIDLRMLQLIDPLQQRQQSTKSSALHYFCSGSCYELFIESESKSIGDGCGNRNSCGDGQKANDGVNQMSEDDYDGVDDLVIFKTTSTQTDEVIIECV